MMNAEEMQRKIIAYEQKMVEYEKKIRDYEEERVGDKLMIGCLMLDISERDTEIQRAKFTVLQALPELNNASEGINPFADIVRTAGFLDKVIFENACREAWLKAGKAEDEKKTSVEADNLYVKWSGLIESEEWQLYSPRGQGGFEFENSDLVTLKCSHGESLYNEIKRAWLENLQVRRTGVMFKPWNYEAGREKTLTELLELLLPTIQVLRSNT